ncbi:MAG: ABC transporter permease [Planctomycetota bacterium]
MLAFAFSNLLSRPARSVLALLGLTVAIAGMVGLFSVSNGIDATIRKSFDKVPGMIALQPGAPVPLFSTLPASWQAEIAAVDGVHAVNAEVWQRINVMNGKETISPPRFFCGTDIASRIALRSGVFKDSLVEGRFLEVSDRGTTNCVLSRAIADEFGKGIGDRVVANGLECTIVGLYDTGSLLFDIAVLLDIGVVREVARFDPASVSGYYIEPAVGADVDALSAEIESLFVGRERRPWRPSSLLAAAEPELGGGLLGGIAGAVADFFATAKLPESGSAVSLGEELTETALPRAEFEASAIELRTASDWSQQFDRLSGDLDLFLTLLTAIGIVIAVLSVINTMLMSVSERVIEFGILKANGWSRRHVLTLVTAESALLGFGGGVLGATTGWAATEMLNYAFPDRLSLYAGPNLVLFAMAFGTILGGLGGLYPAVWAMRMEPMEAIRRG